MDKITRKWKEGLGLVEKEFDKEIQQMSDLMTSLEKDIIKLRKILKISGAFNNYSKLDKYLQNMLEQLEDFTNESEKNLIVI